MHTYMCVYIYTYTCKYIYFYIYNREARLSLTIDVCMHLIRAANAQHLTGTGTGGGVTLFLDNISQMDAPSLQLVEKVDSIYR